MSRSRRKTPIIGNTVSSSERYDKRRCNRKLRRRAKAILIGCDYNGVCECIFPDKREILDTWLMSKDGKHWISGNDRDKLMRK